MEDRQQQKTRIRKLITRVGEEGKLYYKRDLLKLFQALMDYCSDAKKEIIDYIVLYLADAVCYLPNKSVIYALLCAILSTKQPNLTQQVIERIFNTLQQKLNQGDLMVPKNSLNFFSQLMNIGLLNSYSFLTLLFDLSNETQRTLQTTQHYYIEIIVKVLPHCIQGLHSKITQQFKGFIETVSKIIKKFDKKSDLVQFWNIVNQEIDTRQWGQLVFKSIIQQMPKQFERIKQTQKTFKIGFREKTAKVCFESPPASHLVLHKLDYDRLVKRQYIRNTLVCYWKNKEILYQKLALFDTHFGTSSEEPHSVTKFLVEVLITEAIRPKNFAKPVFYASLLLHLSQFAQQGQKKIIKQTIIAVAAKLYDSLQFLDDITEPFSQVLSFYISNMALEWPWELWAQSRQPQKVLFLRTVIQKTWLLISRESFEDRLRGPAFEHVMLDFEEMQFRYKQKQVNQKQYEVLLQKIKDRKQSGDILIQHLKESCSIQSQRLQVFMEVLISVMKNSVDHLTILLERYDKVFKYFKSSEGKFQDRLFKTMCGCWRNSTQILSVFIEKIIVREIVGLPAFQRWCLQQLKQQRGLQEEFKIFRLHSVVSERLQGAQGQSDLQFSTEVSNRREQLKKK